jgi:hypothetical protein
MAIDYSNPGYKEMFANYGLTALAAQAIEKSLLLLLSAVECLEVGKVSKRDLHNVFEKHDRKTLGQLITALRKKVAFPQPLEDNLCLALEKRNYVMHDFFLNRFDITRLQGSPEKMSEELRPIRDLFHDVQERTDTILETMQKKFGVSAAKLDQQARQLLKSYQSSNKGAERDGP